MQNLLLSEEYTTDDGDVLLNIIHVGKETDYWECVCEKESENILDNDGRKNKVRYVCTAIIINLRYYPINAFVY